MPDREAILLVRLDGLGDAALCIPALEGLSRAFPGAEFGAVCSPANAALFSQRIRRVHVLTENEPEDLERELKSQRYTRALIATEEVAGYKLGRLSGAPSRAGFWHRFHKPFKSIWQRSQVTSAVYRPASWISNPEHEVVTLYRLAEALGAKSPVPDDPASLRTWLGTEASQKAAAARGALGFQISPKLFSGDWGPAAVARAIGEALAGSGCERGVLLASSADERLAWSVLEHLGPRPNSVASLEVISALSLPRWLGVLDSIETLVTPDTGAAHVAGMLGVGVIDLFDEPDFERISRQWRPWAGPSHCLMKARFVNGLEAALGRQIASAARDIRRGSAEGSPLSAKAT